MCLACDVLDILPDQMKGEDLLNVIAAVVATFFKDANEEELMLFFVATNIQAYNLLRSTPISRH